MHLDATENINTAYTPNNMNKKLFYDRFIYPAFKESHGRTLLIYFVTGIPYISNWGHFLTTSDKYKQKWRAAYK